MEKAAFYPFKLGTLKIRYENEKITQIKRTDFQDEDNCPNELTHKVYSQISEYFSGNRKEFDFPYVVKGTDFQKKVWKALLDIPYGETRTYKQIAQKIGNEKACRAVGFANSKNPIFIVIPCHRVIGSDGKSGGYSGGLDMKEYLLETEKKYK